MGQGSAETVREIETIRNRIESNVRELDRRVPQPELWLKRLIGAAIGGGMAAIILVSVLWRMRVSGSRKAIDAADGVVLVRMSDLRNLLAGVE